MVDFDARDGWSSENITALTHPISEFNARGGMDFMEYLAFEKHMTQDHAGRGAAEWEGIQKELPEIELLEDPYTGQKLRVQKFNWPEDPEEVKRQTVTSYSLPFSVPIDLPHLEYQHYLLADALKTPLIIIENPGYGDSDKLSPAQKKAVRQADFKPIARTMAGIMQDQNIRQLNAIGYSMGAETAAALALVAKEYDIEIKKLFVMESPRVEDQNSVMLFKNFAGEAKDLKFAWKHPIDPVLRHLAKLGLGLPKGLFSYGLALHQGGLEQDLDNALLSNPKMELIMASGGLSKVSRAKANTELYRNLKNDFPHRSIRRIVMPGETHSFGDTGRRYADLARIVLR